MEVLRGRGRDADSHVVFRAEGQEALHPRARVFRPLAFEAVRQEHDQIAGLMPLGFGTGDEVIDDDLRAVGEIAELGFPCDQCERVGDAVAELESEHGGLRKRAVEHLETGPGPGGCAAAACTAPRCPGR